MPDPKSEELIQSLRRTFEIERRAIESTMTGLDTAAFCKACALVLGLRGRLIVTGMGKSGHVARKIASTLSSTGTPAFFLHPAEATHGDMGMLRPEDAILMISKSGESDELFQILPAITAIKLPVIAITAESESKLALAAKNSGGVVLCISVDEEACPNDLAPTASTTSTLVLGDALAMALLEARKFSAEDFAKLHPAGALGRRLTLRVRDLMITGDAIPSVSPEATLASVMMEMSAKRLGATTVMENGKLAGIITDGDLRRYFLAHPNPDTSGAQARDIMTKSPRTTTPDILAFDALRFMEEGKPKVMHLLVVNEQSMLVGIVHLHDIVKAGIS